MLPFPWASQQDEQDPEQEKSLSVPCSLFGDLRWGRNQDFGLALIQLNLSGDGDRVFGQRPQERFSSDVVPCSHFPKGCACASSNFRRISAESGGVSPSSLSASHFALIDPGLFAQTKGESLA